LVCATASDAATGSRAVTGRLRLASRQAKVPAPQPKSGRARAELFDHGRVGLQATAIRVQRVVDLGKTRLGEDRINLRHRVGRDVTLAKV